MSIKDNLEVCIVSLRAQLDAANHALATARAEQINLLQQVSILTNERDSAVARNNA